MSAYSYSLTDVKYQISSLQDYFEQYRFSLKYPEAFWGDIAEENFVWYQRWKKVLNYDMFEAKIEWFQDAKLNITQNCLDRHLAKRGKKTAIIWQPNNPNDEAVHLTYEELAVRVNKTANMLKAQGLKKGDRICIYLPMILELPIVMLACARIGVVHSVIFAGFSAQAIANRINDSGCNFVITGESLVRGNKTMDLKKIMDEALSKCPQVTKVLVVRDNPQSPPDNLVQGRDFCFATAVQPMAEQCTPEIMDAEDPLFILYTSGSTGKPKGLVHTQAGYMVYVAYTFKNIFQYQEQDIYWCTADLGWITGHSYILYGPLLNGATTVMFEGIPSYPDPGAFWRVVEKNKITHFYTAPTAIRALAKEGSEWVEKYDLSSLKVIASVGEPINDEAWRWYNDHVGHKKCPLVDTWWQTETGGVMITPIPFVTPTKPSYATLPLPGIKPVLLDSNDNEIQDPHASGDLCIAFPWPGMARSIWGNHQRYKETYFSQHPGKYFSGDGAYRDEVGYYRITGRVDDVIIVSGHNLGTAPIEDSINQHPAVAESAIVGFPHPIKGNALYGFIMLKNVGEGRIKDNLRKEINQLISDQVGPIAKLDKMQFVLALPKTRSGKIMRRILRALINRDSDLGDTSTLINPECISEIREGLLLDSAEKS